MKQTHPHHHRRRRIQKFRNPPGGPKRKFSLYKRLYYFIRRLSHLPPPLPDTFITPKEEALAWYEYLKDKNTLTWLGHSSFIIKLHGKTILTDPFLTDFASPIAGLGPKRFSPPGIAIADLPPIDIIIVSHDHYDHCDVRTIANLPHKHDIDVVVPLHLGKLFKRYGYSKIHELDWHDKWSHGGVHITALPAYHYSKRHLLTRNRTLWAAYAIRSNEQNIYFSGDTAYGAVFSDIGKDYGPFDYALVSIGSYDPPYFMLASHLSPEQAVQVGKDLRAKRIVAMHWGTLILSDEPPLEPPLRFHHAAQSAHFPYQDIWILNIGETRKL